MWLKIVTMKTGDLCDDCKNAKGVFNMKNICCVVRHIKMQFLPKCLSRTDYAISLAKKYNFTIEELNNGHN
jgi:hypothetical protein